MRWHQMWDDFLTFVNGGAPHGPPARPDTNKLAGSIDAAPLRESQVDPTAGIDGPLTVQESQKAPIDAPTLEAQSAAARARNRTFVQADVLQILRAKAELTNLQMQSHPGPIVPPEGFRL